MNAILVFLALFGAIYCRPENPAKDTRHPCNREEPHMVDPDGGSPNENSPHESKKMLESLDAEMTPKKSTGKNRKRFIFSFGRAHQMAHQSANYKHRFFHQSHFHHFMKNFKRTDQGKHDKLHRKESSKRVVPKAD